MIPSSQRFLSFAGLALFALACTTSFAQTTLYWDVNGATAGAGNPADGTWNTTNTLWSTSAAGDVATAAYTSGSNVVFSAGSDAATAAVTLGSGVTSNSLSFEDGAVTMTGNNTISLGAGGLTIGAAAGVTTIGNTTSSAKITASAAQTWTNNSSNKLLVGGGTLNGKVTVLGPGLIQFGTDATANSIGGAGGLQIGSYDSGTSTYTSGNAALFLSTGGFGTNNIYLVSGSLNGPGINKMKGLTNTTFYLQGDFTINCGIDSGSVKGITLDSTKVLTFAGGTSSVAFTAAKVDESTAGTALSVAGNGTFSITGTGSNYSGGTVLGGTGVLRIAGDGSLGAVPGVASTNITFQDNATLQAGAATVALGATRNVSIASGKTATINSNGNSMSVDGVISGSGNLTKSGSGTLTLNGLNTYSGITSVTGGTLAVSQLADGGSASGLGNSSNAPANLLLSNATTLQYTGATASSDRRFTINGTANTHSATLDASGTGAINYTNTGTIAYGTNNQTRTLFLTGTNTGDNTLAATINNNGSGVVSLTKNGTGAWVLTGNHLYTGTTTVTAGTLIIGGSGSINGAVSITGGTFKYDSSTGLSKNVTINGGSFVYNSSSAYSGALTLTNGTVGGRGNLSNTALTIGANGRLSPGNSPGALNTGSETWASSGIYTWEINKANGGEGTDPGWDVVNINGNLSITATSSSKFTIDLTGLNLSNVAGAVNSFNNTQNYTWTIASVTGSIIGFDAAAFNLDLTNFTSNNSIGTGSFSIVQSGNDINLQFNGVPEPSTHLLLAFAGLVLTVARRRRSAQLR